MVAHPRQAGAGMSERLSVAAEEASVEVSAVDGVREPPGGPIGR